METAVGDDPELGFLVYRHDYRTRSGIRKNRLALIATLDARDHAQIRVGLDLDANDLHAALGALEGGVQCEPVISGFEDLHFEVEKFIEKTGLMEGPPLATVRGTDEDRHRLWCLRDPKALRRITEFFRGRDVYLLGGLDTYRAMWRLRDREAPGGSDDRGEGVSVSGATHAPLVALFNLFDFGVALSAHHVLVKELPSFDINEFVLRVSPYFSLKTFPFDAGVSVSTALANFREELRVLGFTTNAVGAYVAGVPQFFILQAREDVDSSELFLPDVQPDQRKFDAFLLRRVLFERFLPVDPEREFEYAETAEEAVHAVESRGFRAAFFLNAPNKRRMLAYLRSGARLPPRSVALDPPVPAGLLRHTFR